MADQEFKCSKCDRTFSMAAHLARHASAAHGAKRTAKAAKKRKKTAKKRKKTAKKRKKTVKKRRKAVGKRAPKRTARRAAGRPKARKKKVGRAAVRRRAPRPPAGRGRAGLISRIRAHHRELSARGAELEGQIATIDRAIEALGAAPAQKPARPGGRRVRRAGRAARAGSLKEYIVRVLRQRRTPLSPKQIAANAVKAGYKTKSKTLHTLVSNALGQMTNIRKAGRGLYRV